MSGCTCTCVRTYISPKSFYERPCPCGKSLEGCLHLTATIRAKELHARASFVKESTRKRRPNFPTQQRTPLFRTHPLNHACDFTFQVKTLRGGKGRRSHDEARPWGGLGFDVKSNTYAVEPGADDAIGQAGASAAGAGGPRRSSVGATPRKGLMETSPGGRTRLLRGEGFIERLLGSRVVAGTPKY